jgi:hypothetical protein
MQPSRAVSPLPQMVSHGSQEQTSPNPPLDSVRSNTGSLSVRSVQHAAKSPATPPSTDPANVPGEEESSAVSHMLIVDDNMLNRRVSFFFFVKYECDL